MNIKKLKVKRANVNLHETYMDKEIAGDNFSIQHGEGHLRKSVSTTQIYILFVIILLITLFLIFRIGYIQIVSGEEYRYISENNNFDKVIVLSTRGNIYDRNGEQLAWNEGTDNEKVPNRKYIGVGFSSLLGFIRYPQKDKEGNYFRQETKGFGGLEELYNETLSGRSGSLVLEKNATGENIRELYIEEPHDGNDVTISIDYKVQEILFDAIKKIGKERNFKAGSGTIIDIETGEIITLVSYPDFDNNILTNSSSKEKEDYINIQDGGVFINRAISGLYSPGSTIKPFFAIAALEEGIIEPHDIIVSTGSISIQNPYDKEIVYVYKDRKELGALNIYDAIALSSNVYFYHIGGGYAHIEEGLGIDRIKLYANTFGFGRKTNIGIFSEPDGLVPDRQWKEEQYGEEWRIGDTFNTVIGQYAFQTTPLQLTRAIASIANGGYLVKPHFEKNKSYEKIKLSIEEENIKIVKDGMRRAVTYGTAKSLNSNDYKIAVKTGTAQVNNDGLIDSLLIGFFPYDNPKYAFSIIMENSQEGGAISVAKIFFDKLNSELNRYIK